jgi:hypothetical protein
MSFQKLLMSVAFVGALAASGSASADTVYIDFSGNAQFGPISGQLILDVVGGTAVSGTAVIGGSGFPQSETLGLVTSASYPGPSTGYRSGDGTDVYGGDTIYPIDYNGLIFGTNAPGASSGGYVFAIWNNGGPVYSSNYQGWISGPGGPGSFYGVTGAITTAVPELSTWAMMLAGFGSLASLGYRRSRKTRPSVSVA